ncbi:MAG: putative oxidoreductase [Colwellia sp.]|jgi:putative oxidoreductase
MTKFTQRIIQAYRQTSQLLNYLQPFALLSARLYVAWVFFAAGLTKLRDWDSTLFLFEEEYSVPFIPFELAAYLGTAGELILPVLLVLGIASRFSALGLSVVNIVAVISLSEIAPAALYSHVIWGLLLLQIVLFSAGKLSLDNVFKTTLLKDKIS